MLLLSSADFFQNYFLFQKILSGTLNFSLSNGLDRHFVAPDMSLTVCKGY